MQTIKELLSEMSAEEKIRQTQMLNDFGSLLDGGVFSAEKAELVLNGMGIGCVQVLQMSGLPEDKMRNAIRDFQNYLKTNTKHGIPALMVAETLHGVMAKEKTSFPQSIALSSSWNEELIERVAESIAEEAENVGISQALAPDLDLARDPRWGRVEETYGEDPYLTGKMGARYVRGIQKHGKIAATLKHFAAHGMPESGVNLAPVSAGERQVRELYLPAFEEVMKEKPLSVMPAYSEWDGVPCSASEEFLTQILREEMGFDGYVISDYGAIEMLCDFHHTADTPAEAGRQALLAGIDLEAPNEYGFGKEMLKLIRSGELPMEALDRAVERILTVKERVGLLSDEKFMETVPDSRKKEHKKLALEAAGESIVLLKNEGNILPLSSETKSIALIGPNAASVELGDYCITMEGVSLLEGLKEGYQGEIRYCKGSTLYNRIPGEAERAAEMAAQSDVVVLVLGGSSMKSYGVGWGSEDRVSELTCGEGYDSVDVRLPEAQMELAEKVLAAGKPVILIMIDGRPEAIPEIYDRAEAILYAWYPGEEGGKALTDILFGRINPSAKLTVNIPKHVGQIPMCYNRKPSARGFYHNPGSPEKPGQDYTLIDPAPYYEFGYGLSYTQFMYSSLEIERQGEKTLVRVNVKNIGSTAGKEIVQLYVNDEVSSVTTPVKALKGFCKILLQPGEEKQVEFELGFEELYLIDRNMNKVVEKGWFEVTVGNQTGRFYIEK